MSRLQPNWQVRYNEAHKQWFIKKYPSTFNDGHYSLPKTPIVSKSNGLTNFIVNAVNWLGGNATRVSSAGRLIDGVEKQPSGTVLKVKKFIPSTTRKGTADITATIKGKSCLLYTSDAADE